MNIVRDNCLESIEVLRKLINFLKPLQRFPKIFFTNGNLTDDYDTFKANEHYVKEIFESAGEYEIAAEINIFPLNYLLYYMSYVVKPPQNISKEDWLEHPFNSLDAAHRTIKTDAKKFQPFTVRYLF